MPTKTRRALRSTTNLVAAMAALQERVSNLINEFEREREGAAAHRRELREVVSALAESVRSVSTSVKVLSNAVTEMRPVVEDYSNRRAEAVGAVKLARLLKTLLGGGLVLIGWLIARFFPPPV